MEKKMEKKQVNVFKNSTVLPDEQLKDLVDEACKVAGVDKKGIIGGFVTKEEMAASRGLVTTLAKQKKKLKRKSTIGISEKSIIKFSVNIPIIKLVFCLL